MGRRGNREGSIYRRKDGRWAASLSLGNGRRKTFYAQTRQEASAKLTAALRNCQLGVPPSDSSQTVGQYLTNWLERSVRPSVRPRTHESYDLNVRRLAPHLGRYRLSALSPAAIEGSYGALLEAGLSRRSVEQAHAVLHRALAQAVKWGLLGRNPSQAVNVPRPQRREMRTFDEEQVRRLFEATADHRLHGLWVLLVTTGLRLGEALGLRWEDIDLTAGRLVVKRALQRQREAGLVFVEPKSAKSRRTVHLAGGTVATLREHRRRQLVERLHAGPAWQDHDLAFCREDGRPLEPSGVAERFREALKVADLPRLRVHDLRHTAATLLLGRGVHPKVVQELLGHSTISLTLDTYSHVTPALHAEVATHMDAIFKPR
jgi:integrase